MEYGSKEVAQALERIAAIMRENKQLLVSLDAKMGDGDLGVYMASGFTRAAEGADLKSTPGELLQAAGKTIAEEAPSTLGTLLGVALRKFGKTVAAAPGLDEAVFVRAWEAAYDEIQRRGKARRGEKTILDTLGPALDAMKDGLGKNLPLGQILQGAYEAAKKGLEESKTMKAVHGRPAYFGERTIGMQDGGATVGVFLLEGLCAAHSK